MMHGTFKHLGQLLLAAAGVGARIQMLRRLHRATSVKVKHSRYTPHEGEREKARRRRQSKAGMLSFHYNQPRS